MSNSFEQGFPMPHKYHECIMYVIPIEQNSFSE